MIPKIIHFCWLSADPYPKKIKRCIDSWGKHLDGYDIRLWDFNRFPRGKSKWVDQAFDNKKYAFAADYIRAYALYHEGGIYLDSDVETLDNFDKFLHLPYMLGIDSDSQCIEAAVMGSEKHNPLYKALLDYYDNRPFVNEDGSLNITPLPELLEPIAQSIGEKTVIERTDEFGQDSTKLYVFPPDYFSPIRLTTMELNLSPRTVTIHHLAGSWISGRERFKKNIQRFIGPKLTETIQKIKRLFNSNQTA